MNRLAKQAVLAGFLVITPNLFADEVLPVLKAGSEVYSNVTVTSFTATDLFFTHSKGVGNAKLKNLDSDLKLKFKFDPIKCSLAEKMQSTGDVRFRQAATSVVTATTPSAPTLENVPPAIEEDGDPVVPKLDAKSFRGQQTPPVIVEQWLTPAPDVNGKFVLIDFWATWCGPCRQSIPHLNELQARFKDELVVIGLSNEPDAEMRKMTAPQVNYYVGTDTHGRTMNAAEVKGIPHAMLIDPKGIVRYEGTPDYLEAKALEKLIAKYSE